MKILFKISLMLYIVVQIILSEALAVTDLTYVLLIIIGNIVRYKYLDHIGIIAIEGVIIYMAAEANPLFVLLYGIIAYDLVEKRKFIPLAPVMVAGYIQTKTPDLLPFIFLIILSCYFSYISSEAISKEKMLKESYDKERNMRYELEQARLKLLASAKEITHIVEIKERNRIARDIHDNIGHSIAGILLQLQAAEKLFKKDAEKSQQLLKKSIDGLSQALVHLRETVHNIKPKENLGIEYIETIIEHFQYCPVDFKASGDFNRLSPEYLEIIATNIKEALTNVSKHSRASEVKVNIDINEFFTRLYIKDNGVGFKDIRENLGLSGMRDRMKNIGGSISINGENGMLIVCIFPMEKGVSVFENINS